MEEEYIDIADLPKRSGLSQRLRNIPKGKAMRMDKGFESKKVGAITAHISFSGRKYHTRQDKENNCVWVWWEEV